VNNDENYRLLSSCSTVLRGQGDVFALIVNLRAQNRGFSLDVLDAHRELCFIIDRFMEISYYPVANIREAVDDFSYVPLSLG